MALRKARRRWVRLPWRAWSGWAFSPRTVQGIMSRPPAICLANCGVPPTGQRTLFPSSSNVLKTTSHISAKEHVCTRCFFTRFLISSLRSSRSNSMARFFCSIPLISVRNSSDRMEISGFFKPTLAKISMTWSQKPNFVVPNQRMPLG